MLLGMLGVSVLTMVLIGINDGYHEHYNRMALIVLVIILSLVFLLLIGLDRSSEGLIQIPLKPLIDLQQKLPLMP
jgi:ABC-type proline/glycine betaine transport system permease subunit